jgi:hypothetical protein
VTRPQGLAWDSGAFEYKQSGNPATPVIAVSPTSQDFGSVNIGSSVDKSFIVKNDGAGTLSGSATVSAPFSIPAGGTYNLGAAQSQAVTIRFTPSIAGSANGTVTLTGGDGAIISVSGSGVATASGLSFASTSGTITSPFVANGGFISQPSETSLANGGRAVFGFNIAEAGDYVVSINVDAPNDGSNSIFINIDGEPTDPTMIWDIVPFTNGTENRFVGWRGNGTFDAPEFPVKTFSLSAGNHQLIIVGREPNTRLGTITLITRPKPPENLRVVSEP